MRELLLVHAWLALEWNLVYPFRGGDWFWFEERHHVSQCSVCELLAEVAVDGQYIFFLRASPCGVDEVCYSLRYVH
jgi:hypothetical protein